MWVKFRHKLFHFIFRPLVHFIMRIKYGFRSKKVKLKGPHLILFNHPTNTDPVFVGSSMNKPTYFIANEALFSIPYVSKILNYIVAPIPKQKSMKDTSAIRTAIKVIKEGGNVGVAPEGNRNYSGKLNHIDLSTIKFMKLLKVPVVLYAITGGFGINPRFSKTLRKGKVFGKVVRILSVEEVSSLSIDELYKIVIDALDVDDTLLGLEYKGDALAEHMESVFYVCPVCNKMHTIRSNKNHIHCDNCNMSAEYTPRLLFESTDERFKFKKVREYYDYQNEFILKQNTDELSYVDEDITLYDANRGKKREPILTGTLVIKNNLLYIKNDDNIVEYKITDIIAMAILYHNTIIINVGEDTFHFCGNERFNALKYLHLYTLLKNKEKGENYGADTFLGI